MAEAVPDFGDLGFQPAQMDAPSDAPEGPNDLVPEDLRAALSAELADALDFSEGELAQQRSQALDYYYGKPFGNEQDYRSQVVVTHLRDVIEWMLPDLCRYFTAGDEVAKFRPVGREDVAQAEQATDWCNHVMLVLNHGFMILYAWFKDTLLQKNGYVKRYWKSYGEPEREELRGLDRASADLVIGDPSVEVISESVNVVQGPDGETQTHDLVILRRPPGHICIENVAPEHVIVCRDCGEDLQQARFVAEKMRLRVSDLMAMGFEEEDVENWPSDEASNMIPEEYHRETVDDSPQMAVNPGGIRGPNETKVVYECYYRWDLDGDGVPELLKVWSVGGVDGEVVDVEPAEDIPFSYLACIPEPHRHYGQSEHDLVGELQLIDSAILRRYMDNLNQTANSREIFRPECVDVKAMTSKVPGQQIPTTDDARQRPLGDIVMPLPAPTEFRACLEGLQFTRELLERRTGQTSYNQGTDIASLNQTATGITQIYNAAQKRTELQARIWAETGIRDLFRAILRMTVEHDAKPQVIRLRGQWAQVDPRTWNTDMDVTVTAGLGAGNRDQMAAHLTNVLQVQQQIVQAQGGGDGPLVYPENIYHSVHDLLVNIGFKDADRFIADPQGKPPPPPKPNPDLIRAQADAQRTQGQQQTQMAEIGLKTRQLELDHEYRMAQLQAQGVKIGLGAIRDQSEGDHGSDRGVGEG